MQGKCKLCLDPTILKKSHAIADSVFKRILRANAGKGITLTLDDEYIAYSSDSWWEYQLCETCEGKLNREYENYSLRVLRGAVGKVTKLDRGISFNGINQYKLNMFFLSILWRASVSRHQAYSAVSLGSQINEYFRSSFCYNRKIPVGTVSVSVSRLFDGSKSGGFSLNSLKGLIVSPFYNGKEFCYAFEGFYIRISLPGVKLTERTKVGVIRPTKNILLVPFINIFDIPELSQLMVKNYAKHIEGKSRINKK